MNMHMDNYIKPKKLAKGSKIGIAAASSAFSKDKFLSGVKALQEKGFEVYYQDSIFRKDLYLAGIDSERTEELNLLFNDDSIDAVMFARGGYGLQRIIPDLDFSGLKKRPKVIIGFSDITPLLSYLLSTLNMTCLYGPVITQLGCHDTLESLSNTLLSSSAKPTVSNIKVIKEGKNKGVLKGGCITLLSTSVNTPYDLDTGDSILFLEDTNEKIYVYDRYLTHLRNFGFFDNVKGLVFGSVNLTEGEDETDFWKMINDVFRNLNFPIISGLSSGHTAPFYTLPLGVRVSLEAKESSVEFEFKENALAG